MPNTFICIPLIHQQIITKSQVCEDTATLLTNIYICTCILKFCS